MKFVFIPVISRAFSFWKLCGRGLYHRGYSSGTSEHLCAHCRRSSICQCCGMHPFRVLHSSVHTALPFSPYTAVPSIPLYCTPHPVPLHRASYLAQSITHFHTHTTYNTIYSISHKMQNGTSRFHPWMRRSPTTALELNFTDSTTYHSVLYHRALGAREGP